MNYNTKYIKCCCNTPKQCTCQENELVIPEIIAPIRAKCEDTLKHVICNSEPVIINCEREQPLDKCPTNSIVSISKLGSKLVITMNDCTYYETDIDNLDFSGLDSLGIIVTSVQLDELKDNLIITYYDSKNKTSEDKYLLLPIQKDTFLESGYMADDTLILTLNSGESVRVDFLVWKDVLLDKIQQLIDNQDNSVLNSIRHKLIKSTGFSNNIYSITLQDNTKFNTDLSSLVSADKYVLSGTLLSNKRLRLIFNDNSNIEIDLSSLIATANNAVITSGKVEGTNLIFTLSDNSSITVDISELINDLVDTVTNNIRNQIIEDATNQIVNNFLKLGYRINTQTNNYTVQVADLDGRTIIRANSITNQNITIIKPTEDKIGTALVIRKTNGDLGTVLNLIPAAGVSINPVDITPLRRLGSSVTLIYTGSGNWDVFGELP